MNIYIIILALAVISAMFILYKFSSSANWKSTSGKIVSFEIEEIISKSNNEKDYKINLEYTYNVNGQDYSGGKLVAGFPNVLGNKKDSEYFRDIYKTGEETKVFYNPENHEQSSLITSKGIPTKAYLIMVLFIIGIGTGLFFVIKTQLFR